MDITIKRAILWGLVFIMEAVILKWQNASQLWIYVMLPILVAYLISEALSKK